MEKVASNKLIKIAITGPESTGKTTLASELAAHYQTIWVEEFARDYLMKKNGIYKSEDLLYIAEQQYKSEQNSIKEATKLLICDTEFINIKIWSIVKYGFCNDSILNLAKNQDYNLILLCKNDIPWENDLLRENHDKGDELFELFVKELKYYEHNYHIIDGSTINTRKNKAINEIDKVLNKNTRKRFF